MCGPHPGEGGGGAVSPPGRAPLLYCPPAQWFLSHLSGCACGPCMWMHNPPTSWWVEPTNEKLSTRKGRPGQAVEAGDLQCVCVWGGCQRSTTGDLLVAGRWSLWMVWLGLTQG